MSEKKWLSPKEAARKSKMSESWLAKRRMTPGGPRWIKIGGRVFYREDWMDEFLLSCERQSTNDNFGELDAAE